MSFHLRIRLQKLNSTEMEELRSRLISHAKKVEKLEEMEAMLAGVFTKEAMVGKEKFVALVREVIKPAFDEFKATLRDVGRDAVIITNLTPEPTQSAGLTLILLDRYLSFGAGKTVKLVNPKQTLSKGPNTKFYEMNWADNLICIRQKTDAKSDATSKHVGYGEVTPKFMVDELSSFFERAYPTTS
jgi:hypothetical protein